MHHGKRTAHAARVLRQELAGRGLQVYFDHGEQGVDPPEYLGEIVSSSSAHHGLAAQYAKLDIAVVRADTNEAVALIEVEESVASPKLLLGDILATLLGDQVTFKSETITVGPTTTLIVLTRESSAAKRQQMSELARRVRALQPALTSRNAAIGRIVVDTYAEGALVEVISRLVEEATVRSDRSGPR
jgi:hypothetical protein